MGRFSLNISDKLEKEFRDTVGKKKGVHKGVLTEALEEAIKLWLKENSS